MIRIVFSGTHKGFSHWYASDLKYPPTGDMGFGDPVYKMLLDRRVLYPLVDRLDKMGYSFQPISAVGNRGVFFHKILLLSDHFGREGFMMASLFLPEGKWLDGHVIREALDRLVDHYRSIASMGQTVVELDWSFVDREAEALNQQVESLVWNTLPPDNATQGSALIKGLGVNDVDRFFSYPYPLYRKLSCYEQVFLTEELLSPTSTDYIVLDKDDVDPTNPDVIIPRPSGYNILLWTADSMKMKDLVAACANNDGRFLCGRVSRPGYREGEAFINNEDVDNLNGREEVKVTLPELKRMEASVTLQLVDKENSILELKAADFTVEWSCEDVKSKPSKQGETTFNFEGEQCGKLWKVSVTNPDYEKSKETIQVSDGISPILPIIMEHKKLCIIKVSVPDTYKSLVKAEDAVYEAERQIKIEEIKKRFEKYGLCVEVRPGLDVDEVIVTEWPEWEIIANTPMGKIDDPSNPMKFKGSKEVFDQKIETCKNYYVKKGYEFESQHGPNEAENDNRCILRFKEKTAPIPVQSDNTVDKNLTSEQVANVPVVTTGNNNPAATGPKPEEVVTGTEAKLIQGRKLEEKLKKDGAKNTLGEGNGNKKPEDKPEEVSQTFYIPLDGDDLPNYPLFKNYVTSKEASQVIRKLLNNAERLGEKDNNRTRALRVVEDLGGVENQNNGDGEINYKLAEEDAKGITDIPLRECAEKAIDLKKKSFVVKGSDSVRYDKKLCCLTWKGIPSQLPNPNDLQFKEYPKHHYEFANDSNQPLKWAENPYGQKYTVNKIIDQKGFDPLEWFRTHLTKKVVLIAVGIIAAFVICVNVIQKVWITFPLKPISILQSCSREISIDQPSQHDEEGSTEQNGQEETDEDSEEESQYAEEELQDDENESQDVAEESLVQNEIQQEETFQNTGNSGESVMDSLVLAARKVDTLNWEKLMNSHQYTDNYSTYLRAMVTHIESINDSVQKLTVKNALIESDSHISSAMKTMDESTSYPPKKEGKVTQQDQYYGESSPFSYFLDCLDEDRQNWYKDLWGSTTSPSTSGTSSSSSRTSSTSRATTPSIVTPSQNGQNEQDQGNVGPDSGTVGSTNMVTETQPQKEKIEVKNIEDLWGACNKLEHVMSYDDYIKFRCSTDLLRNLTSKINSIKNVINDNNKNSYVGLYNRVNRENIIVVEKFDKLIEELQSLNNTKQ